jgi:DNA-binding NarL/FixJ family response regulator
MNKISVVMIGPHDWAWVDCMRLLESEADLCVLGRVGNMLEALRIAAHRRLDVIVVESRLIDKLPTQVVYQLHDLNPLTGILVVADHVGEYEVASALSFGANGILGRNQLATYVVRAIRALHNGEAWIPRELVGTVVGSLIDYNRGRTTAARKYH